MEVGSLKADDWRWKSGVRRQMTGDGSRELVLGSNDIGDVNIQ